MSEPTSQDRQINDSPDVFCTGEPKFMVRWVTKERGSWFQKVEAYCEYCRKDIQIDLEGPLNKPKFLIEEAKRLALLEHLRAEHVSVKKKISN